ncbi:hypothetical protein CISIN_1g0481763mg, partial [Citrus sinensis]
GSRSKLAEVALGLSFLSLGTGRSRSGLISIRCCKSLRLFRWLRLARLRRCSKGETEMFKGPSTKAVLDWELVEAEVAAG